MMKAAAESARQSSDNPKLLVSILLTSPAPMLKNELAVTMEVNIDKRSYLLAVQAGIDGIIFQRSLPSVKPYLPAHFHVITPGIRPAGADIGTKSSHTRSRVKRCYSACVEGR